MNKTFAAKMRTVSAALVVILGVMMFGNGMSLSGFAVPSFSGITNKIINYNNNNNNNNNDDDAIISNISAGTSTELNSVSQESGQENIQIIKTTLDGGDYAPITVKSGIPVKWIISAKAKDINGCNSTLVIPKYNIKKKLVSGDNIIEFTPTKSGTVPYSCWMGMITSTITVVEK